ncbi:MAG: NAD-dependent epimerase/dehydratase family protein [Bacteroidales bacterium]|jgi:dihydroflavonol-4-reductase|nr:NAD-dependent epimerase/dehydratase family protein [Bacteroidales bacterium]
MKIFITGADGILGNNLVRLLLEEDHKIKIFIETGRKARFLEELPVEKCYGSILNYEELKNEMQGYDIVIHAAAKTDTHPPRHESYWKVNVEGTRKVIDAVKETGAKRLIHVGTANSFGPGDESDPGDETKAYTAGKYGLDYMCSKKAAQDEVLKAVREEGLDAVIVNPTFMIGPYDSKPSSGTMILAVNKGKIPGYPSGGRNFVYVGDVAAAIAAAIEKGRRGECYIAGNENLAYREAFGKMALALGVKPPGMKMPRWLTLTYGRLMTGLSTVFPFTPPVNYPMALISTEKHYYSNEKAKRELGLQPTPVSEALEEAVKWFRNNGYIN